MMKRDYRDALAGLVLTIVGVSAALYASHNYNLGTFRRMGSGMMPTALGWILAGFGVAILVGGLLREGGRLPEFRSGTALMILGSVAGFALTVTKFGLLPAVVVSTVISAAAEWEFRPVLWVVLSAFLCLLSWAVFSLALRLPVPLLMWPF